MIRKKREILQMEIFGEKPILDEPSFLKSSQSDTGELEETSREFDNPMLMGKADNSTTDSILADPDADSESVVPESDTNEFLKKDPERLIINRDFADGFYVDEASRKKQVKEKAFLDPELLLRQRRYYKIAAIVLLSIACLLLLNWQDWVVNSPLFTVQNIDVRGNFISTKDEIKQLADLSTGGRLAQVDVVKAAERVRINPLFESVVVSRSYPSSIVINVEERTPVAFISSDQLYAIDRHGVIMPRLKPKLVYNVPVITGFTAPLHPGKTITSEKITAILNFLQMAQAMDEALYYEISEINLTRDDFTLYLNNLSCAFKIDDQNFARTVIYLSAAFQYFRQSGVGKEVRIIDLRYNGQILVRNKS
ncbi:FtsQ-type POTRA domain-containing protein [bacterium]|nr:FtsQ-type POTRA domain-containing protein [bacterium]